MHTFFINTSARDLKDYADIFEVQLETRRFIPLHYAIDQWCDQEAGYEACVRKMSELIDSYKDINNDFNVIIYVDLISYERYASIATDKHRHRYACLKALRAVLKRYIKDTLIRKLDDCGRMPQEVLLIFEENPKPKDCDEHTEDGKQMIRNYTKEFLGLPSENELEQLLREQWQEGESAEAFAEKLCEKANTCFASCLGESVLRSYLEQVTIFLEESKTHETLQRPLQNFLDRVVGCEAMDERVVHSVSFATNRRARDNYNKQEHTRSDLRLCFYIYACVEDQTVFDKKQQQDDGEDRVKPFPDIDWKKTVAALRQRSRVFRDRQTYTEALSDSFHKLKLAPALYALDHERFGLDGFGKRGKKLETVQVDEELDDAQREKLAYEGIVRPGVEQQVSLRDEYAKSLFDEGAFIPFQAEEEKLEKINPSSKAGPQEYIAGAQQLRQYHQDYLQLLKIHVFDTLANYAGRSQENEPAVLRKRKVNVADDDSQLRYRDYLYARQGMPEEKDKIKTVKERADRAYESAVLDYLEFCSGRSVQVTNIDAQYHWFVNRVNQIQESLRKIKVVAFGLIFAILALYIPFAVVQWDAITDSALSLRVAGASLGIPLAVLYLVFGLLTARQHRKYKQAWEDFKRVSDEALAENDLTAKKYDQLLSVFVPTLRWIYEFKLDVDFYAECCDMAGAKLSHHLNKLRSRQVTIGNIVENLESLDPEESSREPAWDRNEHIDYNVSFCSSKKNRKIYAIIDQQFLDEICK